MITRRKRKAKLDPVVKFGIDEDHQVHYALLLIHAPKEQIFATTVHRHGIAITQV